MRWRDLTNLIRGDDSDIYVIYTVFLSEGADLEAHALIRAQVGKRKVIFCGPAPTYNPSKFLLDEQTFVVRGEPDLVLVELCHRLQEEQDLGDLAGLSYLQNNKEIRNIPSPIIQDLDALPFPERSLFDRDTYYNPKIPGGPFTAVLTQRGCPYHCTFCVPNSLSYARELEYKGAHGVKPPLRKRSPQNVIEEMRSLAKAGYTSVSIIDDVFTLEQDRVIEICQGIKGTGIEWGCLARADNITPKLVRALRVSNCRYVDLGVESFNQEILDEVRKQTPLEAIYESIRLLKTNHIMVKINLLLGVSPNETEDDIRFNLKEVLRLRPDAVMFSIATPFPGTELYNKALSNRWFLDGDFNPVSVQHKAIISYPRLSARRLEKMLRWSNRMFYLNPSTILRNIKVLRRPSWIKGVIKALTRKFW
jgi:radical SAM superfamily enzyme YgiQ (UPF0313 family)